MTMSDPLGDMLTRIRNGQAVRKTSIECPYSRLRESVCNVLKDEGFIRAFKAEDRGNNKKVLVIELKYDGGQGVIRQIDRVSKPGCRIYSSVKDMPRFYNGLGILVVSTPNGVMADHKARDENVGGEILCQVF
ncbi:MAG TPA: 30S ribosomal protein S8 [Rhodospirillaceae bacterium]|nr:30S ribosomal protein S8 [Rhodospirillaceae bacterium]